MKITLIGRPSRFERRKDLVILVMSHTYQPTSLPKGVPMPPATPTLYTVYVGSKQWGKIERQLASDPDDAVIIEGAAVYDPEIDAIAVFALNIVSRSAMQAKRQKTQEKTDHREERKTSKASDGESAPAPRPALAPAPEVIIPDGLPAPVLEQIRSLQASALVFRQKITSLESKPEGQRFGLEMTQKLLKNVENEIVTLIKKNS